MRRRLTVVDLIPQSDAAFIFSATLIVVNCFVLPCSPINAPISSSFAGALRWINISSSALMARPLNSANYTESFKGVRFSEVLPRVRTELFS